MRSEPPAAFTQPPAGESEAQFDPLQLCIYTTIGVLAWLVTPAAVVGVFGAMGVFAYVRARRRGLAKSRCKLGDTRLVIAYLAVAGIAGLTFTAVTIARIVS